MITLLIMPKPFASARIPEAIDEAIKKRVESGSESRTDIIVNALNTYLGYPLTVAEGTPAADRLNEIEKRLAVLESKLEKPIQGNLLDNSSVIKTEKEKKKELPKDSSTTDNKVDNEIEDKANDKKLLSNKEVESLTGIKISTIRGRFKNRKVIEKDSYRLTPDNSIRNKPRWRLDNIND